MTDEIDKSKEALVNIFIDAFNTPKNDPLRMEIMKGTRLHRILANGARVQPTLKCINCGGAWDIDTWTAIYENQPMGIIDLSACLKHRTCPVCKNKETINLHVPNPLDKDINSVVKIIGSNLKNGVIDKDLVQTEIKNLASRGNSTAICILNCTQSDDERYGINKAKDSSHEPNQWSRHLGTRTKQWYDMETGLPTKRMWES